MSSANSEPDVPNDTPAEDQETVEEGQAIGNLSIEDDPQGTVDPSDLAGTASDDDADVS